MTVDREKVQSHQKGDYGDKEAEFTDRCVTDVWEFITNQWNLLPPTLIISVIDDDNAVDMSRPLMKSVLLELAKAAAAEGRRLRFSSSIVAVIAVHVDVIGYLTQGRI